MKQKKKSGEVDKIKYAQVVVSGKYGLVKEQNRGKTSIKISLYLKTTRGFVLLEKSEGKKKREKT